MKSWRTWITCLLVITLPLAGNAGLLINSHCVNETQAVLPIPDQSVSDHCSENTDSQKVTKLASETNQCQCECNNHIACMSAGIAGAYISDQVVNYRLDNNSPPIYFHSKQLPSLDLTNIFRPPIYIS